MSRAYRIKVRESATQTLRASDHVSTQLELLEILPPERMAELLGAELQKRGFEAEGDKLVRRENGVSVEVDAKSATVTVRAEGEQILDLEGERTGWGARDNDKQATEQLRQELLKELQKQADAKTKDLQKQITDRLEGHLQDVRRELDAAVNRVTADALKEKAAQLGQIKEMTEDPNGSLTIVLEV